MNGPAWLGSEIAPDKISHKEAGRFLKTLAHKGIVGFRLRGITRNTDLWEFLIVDVAVDRPQHVVNDIRYDETVALAFAPGQYDPAVLPLRSDFPDLMHMSLTMRPYPNSLCLYEQPLVERQLQQTPLRFLERIRTWFALTAIGELHGADQPLEPAFHSEGCTLVLDSDFLKDVQNDFGFTSLAAYEGYEQRIIMASRGGAKRPPGAAGASVITAFVAPPAVHGRMRAAPQSLGEMIEGLRDTGLEILPQLSERILRYLSTHPNDMDRHVIAVVCFPMQREAEGDIETVSYRVFQFPKKIGELGVALGILAANPGPGPKFGQLLVKGPEVDPHEIEVWTLQTAFALNRRLAARLSGTTASTRKITLVGAGTLGSLLAQTLVRSGNGVWTIIDDDVLLPHNVARHAITHSAVGGGKAIAVANLLNDILGGEGKEVATPISANVLRPRNDAEKVETAITTADVVLDASASVAVGRHLAVGVRGGPRRISVFFNPSGLDIVVLCETQEPRISLVALEAQYYRGVIDDQALDGHLTGAVGQAYPVASCRHPSTILSYAKASALVGLGACVIERCMASDAAAIEVLRMDAATGAVRHHACNVAEPVTQTFGDWTICMDSTVSADLSRLRVAALPAETGGVLVGFYDLPRKLVYVVKALPPPPDSIQDKASFERGVSGVQDVLADISRRTLGQVGYVGEWHSHPDGIGARPSSMDVSQLVWLVDKLSIVEQPAVMIIVGENGPAFNVGFAVD